MASMQLPLVRGDKQSNLDYTDLLPVNLTPVIRDIKGDQGYLLANDGLLEFASTSGLARGGHYNERMDKHFRVSGTNLESIGTDGSVEVIGTIPGNDVCQFAASFNTQAILANGRLFLYDGATLEEVISENLGYPTAIDWFRGLYVMTDGEYVFQTDILNEYTISPLKYVTSEFSNDPTVAVKKTSGNQIVAFNSTSTEYFYFNPNAASGVSVLTPVQGKSNKIGIAGVNCVVEMAGAYFCVGNRENESYKFFMIGEGGAEQVFSTRYINQTLSSLEKRDVESIYLESRYKDGQYVLICHLPDCTLIYNHTIAQQMGIKAAWSIAKTGLDDEPWRARYGVFDARIGKWVYGDTKESKLAILDSDSMAQYEEHQECLCYTPLNYLNGNVVMQDMQIQTIPGYAPTDVSLFWSFTDDGVSYGQESTYVISTPLRYKNKIKIRNNGMFSELMGVRLRFVATEKQAISSISINFRARQVS